jgi:hypothetical protein
VWANAAEALLFRHNVIPLLPTLSGLAAVMQLQRRTAWAKAE